MLPERVLAEIDWMIPGKVMESKSGSAFAKATAGRVDIGIVIEQPHVDTDTDTDFEKR